MGTFLVAAILAAVVALIVWRMVKDKKQGKSCGGCAGCTGCAGANRGQCSAAGPDEKAPLAPDAERALKECRL